MGFLLIHRGSDTSKIPAADHVLDRVAELLEEKAASGGGFWLAGQLQVERNGEAANPNPAYGHQRLWVPIGQLVTLVYDRPLHPDPDRVIDEPGVVYL
jgi:hypothetical protein